MRARIGLATVVSLLSALTAGQAGAVSNGVQAGSFMLIGSGARAPAMGEAFTGLADDVSAAWWNPAGLIQLPSLQASLSYAAWFAETSYSVVSIGGPLADGHVLAATIYYFHVPPIANVPSTVEPSVDLSNYAAGLAYSYGLSKKLSMGAGLKMMSQDIEQAGRPGSSSSNAMIDLALLYRHGAPDISVGLALQNMGPKFEFRDSRSPAPFWGRLGLAYRVYRDDWLNVLATADVAQPVDTGYRLVIPEGGISKIFRMSLKGSKQNRYNWGFGTEWWLADMLALRAGWTSRVGSDIDSPSAGAGLKFNIEPFVYALDYSYSFWGDLSSNISRVSFTVSLAPRPHEPED